MPGQARCAAASGRGGMTEGDCGATLLRAARDADAADIIELIAAAYAEYPGYPSTGPFFFLSVGPKPPWNSQTVRPWVSLA